MAVLPGSLDYLYYNGILDHIPYEAYEMSPMTPSGMAQMSGIGSGFSQNQNLRGYGLSPAMQASGMGASYAVNPMMQASQFIPAQQMNGSQYLQSAQKGLLYNTYTYPDTFVRRDNSNFKPENEYSIREKSFHDGGGYGKDVDLEVMANGEEGKNFRQAITDMASTTKETVSNSPNWIKGILAGGIMITTLCCLLKRKKI